ncbi:MAG: hypothetical protein COU47_00770 [Candidatus Niyogibacteria bacterium CG10_big_fil_rev_8_21_14_0_10_46_36]|uniref:Sugar O-methyltransferase n=1 Tax=Candidatus Niyogibacteria bacterium CG10_big_fil_rev_8_21_14_0_10_46_36 TaxID=1974726 RepID=A0A2H0TEI1_9BACT|nr:MAG: hypothetical protein COU47_00770 [Candidatus Niyogibacteria bacterium CG10_big_fil_rev_8_21_14_0_10_46_36]
MDNRFEQLKEFLLISAKSQNISNFWGNQIEGYKIDATKKDWVRLAERRVEGREKHSFGFRKGKISFLDYARFASLKVFAKLARLQFSLLGEGYHEHARALYFLWRRGLYPEYKDFLASFDVESAMSQARYFWYMKVLKRKQQQLFPHGMRSVLEIGAGAGGFALFCIKEFPIERYVIVDLPEMLGHAAFQFIKYTDWDIVYPHQIKNFDATRTVYLLTPEQAGMLPDSFFDASFNFWSFSEMRQSDIRKYIEHIYRAGKAHSVFYNVNYILAVREKNGDISHNNPLFFPYRPDDNVVIYSIDEFHHETRSVFGLRNPTLAMMRLAIINPEK